MRVHVSALIISICCNFYAQGNQNTSNHEDILREKYGPVIFANLLYRHGDRTIIRSFPRDPHRNSTNWNIGYGQLTKKGQERQYKLGQWIKSRYPDLVGEQYNQKNIYIRSSNADRCLMSAQCNLAGMYPVNNTVPPFQPIPIHTVENKSDNMLFLKAPCPAYELEKENQKNSKYMMDLQRRLAPLFQTLTNFTGKKVNDLNSASEIYDTLKIESEDMNLPIPSWTHLVYPDPLMDISLENFFSNIHTHAMKRFKAGPLLTDMVRHLELKANGTLQPDRKLWVYSGHDENIVNLLDALNLDGYAITLPSYASLVSLELRRGKEHFVTVLYKDGKNDTASILRMKGSNEDACTLQQFVKLTKNRTVTDWKAECSVKINPNKVYITDNVAIGAGEIFFVLLFLLIPAIIFVYCCRPKTYSRYQKLNIKHNDWE